MGSVLLVSEQGRLDLPADILKAVGLEQGGPVSVWVEDGEIRVGAVRDVMASLQAEAAVIFKGSNETVDGFLLDRRKDTGTFGPDAGP